MMKDRTLYIIAATLILFGVSVSGYGQSNTVKPEWNFGVAFGPTYSSISFTPTDRNLSLPTKSSLRYHGGISARYIRDNHVGIQAELNYSQLGWEQDFSDNAGGYMHNHQLNYLELPLLTHIYIGNKTRFIINLGPKISYLISESETMNDALRTALGNGTLDAGLATAQYNNNIDTKFDYSLIGGLGVEFRTDIGTFSIEGRYSFGLGDIYNNSKKDGDFVRSANRSAYVRATYFIKLF